MDIGNMQSKVKLSLCLIKHYVMKWGSGCIDPRILDLGTSWRLVVSFIPRPPYPRESAPGTHWIGGWVGPRTALDDVKKRKFLTLSGLELVQPVTSRC
jgi:hypothetical protein